MPLPLDAFDLAPDEVAARFRQARRSGRPRWLWPDLPVDAWRAAVAEIVAAAADELAGRPAALRGDAQALGVAAFTTGMGPLLGCWMERGALAAPADAAEVLALHLAHGRARWTRMRAAMEDALAVLAAAGVPATVVKGMHTAAALFPEPGARPMADVDLVIPPGAVEGAERALAAAGYVRAAADYQRRAYHADWRPPGEAGEVRSLALNHLGNPVTVNLRDGFDRRSAIGAVRLGAPGPADIAPLPGGAGARVLAGPFLVAHLAAHASEQRENLLLVRLVEIVFAFRTGIDGADVARFLASRGIAHHLYPALALAERLAPGTLGEALTRVLEDAAGPRLRRAIAGLDPAYLQRLDRSVAGGRELASRGPADRLRAALHWLVPFTAPGRLAETYRTRLARLVARVAR